MEMFHRSNNNTVPRKNNERSEGALLALIADVHTNHPLVQPNGGDKTG